MTRPTRTEILARLRAKIATGQPIIGGGAGTGLSAMAEEAGGIDLIVIYRSGRYRMAGRGSLAGLLAYGNANDIVVEMAHEVLPVVRYAAAQKARRSADYWDYATLLELAVIGRDVDDVQQQLGEVLAIVNDDMPPWQLKTTEEQIGLIREMRTARGEETGWLKDVEDTLRAKRAELEAAQVNSPG